jgi:uncharacterized membrane protein
MGRLAGAALALLLLFLALTPITTAAQFTSNSMTLNVYVDGSATITQVLSANSSDVSINVGLLTPVLTDVVAVDQNGSPLSFQLSGTNITIYTLGSTGVTLRYDTDALTDKQGTVWTLNFSTAYNTTVVLPQESTVTSVSGTPNSFSEQGGSPVIALSPGDWQVSYGVPISIISAYGSSSSSSSASIQSSTSSNSGSGTQTSVASSGTTGPSGPGSTSANVELPAAALIVIAAVIVAFVLLRKRSAVDPRSTDLRPDDIQVLNYITEKGGKVFEPEIRTRFALPKTSTWRQIKRLERLGYVKITKVGSQNQIEAIKNRGKQDA